MSKSVVFESIVLERQEIGLDVSLGFVREDPNAESPNGTIGVRCRGRGQNHAGDTTKASANGSYDWAQRLPVPVRIP